MESHIFQLMNESEIYCEVGKIMGSSETEQKSVEPVAVAMAYPSAPPDVTAPAPMNLAQPQMGVPLYPPQPLYQLQVATEYGPWSVGLCDCFSDCERFCISFWCPCVTFGQVAEILDRGSSSCGINGSIYVLIAWLTGCPCIYSCFYRSRMRHLYRLQGDCGEDFIVHFCCEACALTQMYRELQNRGFDVSLGWHGNVERQTRGVAMPSQMAPPVVEGGMSR